MCNFLHSHLISYEIIIFIIYLVLIKKREIQIKNIFLPSLTSGIGVIVLKLYQFELSSLVTEGDEVGFMYL